MRFVLDTAVMVAAIRNGARASQLVRCALERRHGQCRRNGANKMANVPKVATFQNNERIRGIPAT